MTREEDIDLIYSLTHEEIQIVKELIRSLQSEDVEE